MSILKLLVCGAKAPNFHDRKCLSIRNTKGTCDRGNSVAFALAHRQFEC